MHLYKKHGFTLAETIMTLFIVGVVIAAAIPSFTVKQNTNVASTNTPWDVSNDTLQTGLKTSEKVSIGGPASTYNNDTDTYDLTVTDTTKTSSSLYDIFKSDKRKIKVADYNFEEDINKNLFIYKNSDTNKFNFQGNKNIVIGSNNSTDGNPVNSNVVLGNWCKIENSGENNVLFGFDLTCNGSNSTAIGNHLTVDDNAIAIARFSPEDGNSHTIGENAIRIGYINKYDKETIANTMQIGDFITATGLEATSTVPPTVTFHGNTTISGTISGIFDTSSDIRLKNIKDNYKKGLKEILQVNPVIFQYKDDKSGSLRIGVIAQEVKKVFPEAVVTMDNGYYGVNSAPIFFASMNALKEINKQKNIEKARQQKLEKELEQLEKELAKLKPSFWDKIWLKINFIFDFNKYFAWFNGGNNA